MLYKEKPSLLEKVFQVGQVVENWNPLVLELKEWVLFARDLNRISVGIAYNYQRRVE